MKVVVFGAGYWGKNYIRELGRYCIMVVDPNETAREEAKERFGVDVSTTLPDSLDFDGAIVTTPPQHHYSVAYPLLKEGKYVLVEKPAALTYEEAQRMAEFDKCMGSQVYLYHPEIGALREIVQKSSDDLSHIFSRRTNQGPQRIGLDAMWDLASHEIGIFNYLFDRMPTVRSKALKSRDFACIALDYGGIYATSYVSWHGGPKTRRLEIVPKFGNRRVFDDMAIVLEEPPLTRMVEAFLSGSWDRCYGWQAAGIVKVLEELG